MNFAALSILCVLLNALLAGMYTVQHEYAAAGMWGCAALLWAYTTYLQVKAMRRYEE